MIITNRLTALKVASIKSDCRLCDGQGLYLEARGNARIWIFRYKRGGKERNLGLGSARVLTLAEARELAATARKKLALGFDPVADKQAAREAAIASEAKRKTFSEVADKFIADREHTFKARTADEWRRSLAKYARPIMSREVASITMAEVLEVLDALARSRPKMYGKFRQRLERIFNWAILRGYRDGDNPADGRKLKDAVARKTEETKHHAAVHYRDLPALIERIRTHDANAAPVLEFTILTALRVGEATKARWTDIDFDNRVYNVPAEVMKMKRPHRVPLSARAIEILRSVPKTSEYIFLNRAGKPMLGQTVLLLMKKLGTEATTHGCRSSFRDWGSDRTNYPREVLEATLAHENGNQTEKAYARSDHFERRIRLMDEWARYLDSPTTASGEVVSIRGAVA
jgi:integrase